MTSEADLTEAIKEYKRTSRRQPANSGTEAASG